MPVSKLFLISSTSVLVCWKSNPGIDIGGWLVAWRCACCERWRWLLKLSKVWVWYVLKSIPVTFMFWGKKSFLVNNGACLCHHKTSLSHKSCCLSTKFTALKMNGSYFPFTLYRCDVLFWWYRLSKSFVDFVNTAMYVKNVSWETEQLAVGGLLAFWSWNLVVSRHEAKCKSFSR